jgi:putative phosphoesterase
MKKIALLSDTHGYLDEAIIAHCLACDEIWHAGDFGTLEVSEKLASIKPLIAVYGNVDDAKLRIIHPKQQHFSCENIKVFMTHIGGYPGHYNSDIKNKIQLSPPDLFISGHSHILKVVRDEKLNNMLHINPGAAGKYGFHKIRTMATFKIDEKKITDLQIIELGKKKS